jgi:hypothetical protein
MISDTGFDKFNSIIDHIKEMAKNDQEILDTPREECYWLVFYGDSGSRESCSVYYSWLTKATNREEAISKVCKHTGGDEEDKDAEPMELLL